MPMTNFNADDAALAVSMMTEAAMADIPFVSRQQLDADSVRISTENRTLVSTTMRLHGLTQLGNAAEGTEDGAQAVINAAQKFKADPTGYADALHATAGDEPPAEAEEPAVSIQATAPATPAPVVTIEHAVNAPAIEEPIAKLRFIPRPAQSLFPGISSTYHNDLVPTAQWDSPKPALPQPDPDFLFNGYAVAVMALAIDERKNVLASGDPGCGKTEFFFQFGHRIGLPVHKVPMDGSLSRSEIIGSFRQVATPNGSATPFVYGRIPTLIQKPGIIILDEIDQSDPDIMYMLHPVLEGGGLIIEEEGGTVIPRHPHCYIVATANTKGRGSDNGLTHTRFEMSEATRDRFPYWLNFTFMKPDDEANTIHAKTALELPLCKKMVAVANMIRTAYRNGEMSQTCSIRQMLDAAPMAQRFNSRGDDIGLALGMEAVMVGRANSDDAAAIREFIKTSVAVDLNTVEI